jgi:hypothetical protein
MRWSLTDWISLALWIVVALALFGLVLGAGALP